MSAPSTVLTLADRILPDGCWTVDTAPIVAAAVAAAGSAKARQGFPRFQLRVDGQTLHTERADTLAKWLGEIKSGETCRVWRNAGNGATINFDA
ncbi:hypothetical protein UFOVP783_20 [uncultured Caudovirales phage]|uniref:Uncharacterized protein n=1 Tax=uncultured Caudovirales phage TaxID=2100421 RepID=A0A6J5NY04_9CAUD|nr:hypothetical protein UFOVP783_20 [uncultured Caudovirales phage]